MRQILVLRYVVAFAIVAAAFVGCSGGNNSLSPLSQPGLSQISPNTIVRSRPEAVLPLKSSVTSRAFESVTELETVYPELRFLKIVEIDAKYGPFKDSRGRTSVSNAVSPPSSPFQCGTGPYRPDAGLAGWSGNAPPNCTPTGVFAGVYSVPNKAVVAAHQVSLPDRIGKSGGTINLPPGPNEPADGFIYIEGWEGPGSKNVEGGLAYQDGSDTYVPYIAAQTFSEAPSNYVVVPNSSIYIRMGTDSSASDITTLGPSGNCANGCVQLTIVYIGGTCPIGYACTDNEFGLAANFTNNCCIFRRMTSIGSSTDYKFSGGYAFGPIQWANPYTATRVTGGFLPDGCQQVIQNQYQTPCPSASFSEGGTQIYPQNSNYVQQTNIQPDTGETDWTFFPS